LETILNKKRENFGPESQEYNNTSQKLCELCNMISLVCLQKEKFEQALEFLKKAEILSISSQNLRALTFNNYACYYRKQGKLRTAHDFL
jgi:tetratricopeptide (TPR) repeat protein